MSEQLNDDRTVNMTIDGHKITLKFSKDYNPTLSTLVRTTLLDAFIRENNLCPEKCQAEL